MKTPITLSRCLQTPLVCPPGAKPHATEPVPAVGCPKAPLADCAIALLSRSRPIARNRTRRQEPGDTKSRHRAKEEEDNDLGNPVLHDTILRHIFPSPAAFRAAVSEVAEEVFAPIAVQPPALRPRRTPAEPATDPIQSTENNSALTFPSHRATAVSPAVPAECTGQRKHHQRARAGYPFKASHVSIPTHPDEAPLPCHYVKRV